MKLRDLLAKWGLTKLKLNAYFLDVEFDANDAEKDAAWALYVELVTRVTVQALAKDQGDEAAALASVHKLFGITRDILRTPRCRHAERFARVAVVVLNQKVRPFTTYWHKASLAGAFEDTQECRRFRSELADLQGLLTRYAGLLSDLAGVENLVDIDEAS